MIRFAYPQSFWLLAGFATLLILFTYARWRRRRDLRKMADPKLLRRLLPVPALLRRRAKDAVALTGLLFLIVAAAGPQFGSHMREVRRLGIDVFIAMDTSRSMLAEDVHPNRIERAKRSLGLLIRKLEGNRIGLIAFAGFALLQCPLTVDTDAARMFLDIMDTDTVPQQGTAIGDAIRLALRNFPKDEKSGKVIILLSDGEDHQSDPIGAAREAQKQGVVIHTIGIGTTQGEAIKTRDETGRVREYHRHQGQMVVSRLDDALLSKIASMTGGHYYRASAGDAEIDEIADILSGFDKRELTTRQFEQMRHRYQIFAFLAFLLLLFEGFFGERPGQWARIRAVVHRVTGRLRRQRGGVIPVLLGCVLFFSAPAAADLKTRMREGTAALKDNDWQAARAAFDAARTHAPEAAFLPYNIANTYLFEGNFEEARRHFEQAMAMAQDPALKARIAYNLATCRFYMGDRDAAINLFKETLRYTPGDMDAKYNIEYIMAGKEPPCPFEPQPQQGDAQKDAEGKDDPGAQDAQSDGDEDAREERERRPGEMSREDAERLMQALQDGEKDHLRQARPLQSGAPEDQKQDPTHEDW